MNTNWDCKGDTGEGRGPHGSAAHNHTLFACPAAHLCLDHVVSPPAKVSHKIEHVNLTLSLHHLNAGIQGDEGAGSSDPCATVHHHWVGGAAAAVVVADTLVEGEDVGGVVWHPVVGPRQEVELLDVTCRVLVPILHRV